MDARAVLGDGVKVWNWAQIREDAQIGEHTIISTGVYIDAGVAVGRHVKIQNHVSVFHGVTIKDGVFVGPNVCFTNDKVPRAVNPDLTPKAAADWQISTTLVNEGASIGANATIVAGVSIGRWAMVGAGAVVTKDVADHALVIGNPARPAGWVCHCGVRVPAVDQIPCVECRQQS